MVLIFWVLTVKIISEWRQYYRQLDNGCYSYRVISAEVLQKLAVILQNKLVCVKFSEAQQLEKILVAILTNKTILDLFLKTVHKISFTCYNCLNLFPSFLPFPLISLLSLSSFSVLSLFLSFKTSGSGISGDKLSWTLRKTYI